MSRSTLYLLCGLPCSGKTTAGCALETEHGALRLTPDDWIGKLGLDPYDAARRAKVEALMGELAMDTLAQGRDVVLDFGVWARVERDAFRVQAAAVGARTELVFLNVSRTELHARLARRNASLPPHTFAIDPADLDRWADQFQSPTADELTGNVPVVVADAAPFRLVAPGYGLEVWSGAGPDYLHVHHGDDELWHVLEGTLTFRFAERVVEAPAGTSVLAPAGAVHTYFEAHGPTRYQIVLPPRLQALIAALHAAPWAEHADVLRRFDSAMA